MFSPALKTRLATALAGAALASALVVSGASAHYGQQTDNPEYVPPPPSSIAVSAAEEYQDLRSPDAIDAAREAGDEPEASTSQDMRMPDTRDAAEGYQPELRAAAGGRRARPSRPGSTSSRPPSGRSPLARSRSCSWRPSGLRRPPRGRPASA